MLSEYAYFLKEGGRLYTVTDVEDLHMWHVEKCNAHVSFARLANAEVSHIYITQHNTTQHTIIFV